MCLKSLVAAVVAEVVTFQMVMAVIMVMVIAVAIMVIRCHRHSGGFRNIVTEQCHRGSTDGVICVP